MDTQEEEAPPIRVEQWTSFESLESYRKGGFHPVHIDDIYHGRYQVLNKLGHGSYGTVWLAEDLTSGRFVSLKILASDRISKDVSEVVILRRLAQHNTDELVHDGQKYIVKFLDDFQIEGPNGTHQCIVTEVLGPALGLDDELDQIYTDEELPIGLRKCIVAKVLRGVAFLHSRGIIHGDLHRGNLLLSIPGVDQMTRADFEHYLGSPQKYDLQKNKSPEVHSPRQPDYVVQASVTLGMDRIELLKRCLLSVHPSAIDPKICDFGESLIWDLETKTPLEVRMHTPCVYAAPEILFRDPITPAVDIWALAVLTLQLLGGGLMFPSRYGVRKEVLKEMVLTLGKLPDRYWTRWDKSERDEYFDEDGKWVGDPARLASVGRKLVWISVECMGEEDIGILEGVLRKMVRYDPQDRISVQEVVQLIPEGWLRPEEDRSTIGVAKWAR